MNTKAEPIFAILLVVIGTASTVLTGYEHNPLENRAFGCEWQGGGIETTLICNCRWQGEELFIQESTIRAMDLNTIRINSCDNVKFGSNAVKSLRNLRRIQLTNIRNLTLEERSLHWEGYVANRDINTPSLRISIENTHIQQIASHTFSGRMNEISFNNVIVENIAPYSFSTLTQNQKIVLLNSEFRNLHPQAFKQFSTEYLTITNCRFGYLPSRAFSELTVTENFLIQNSTFDTIKPAAFLIQNPKRFEVTNSEIATLEGDGFKVTTRGDVLFRNDIFGITHDGAFLGVSVHTYGMPIRKLITFDGLVFNSFSWDSLEINETSFESKITDVLISRPCDCEHLELINVDPYQFQEIMCLLNENEPVSYQDFKSGNCSILIGHTTIIILVCVSLILLIVIVAALVFYFKKVYRGDKYGDEKENKNGKLSMIVPDGRTYRETELHVIVERADLLTTDL